MSDEDPLWVSATCTPIADLKPTDVVSVYEHPIWRLFKIVSISATDITAKPCWGIGRVTPIWQDSTEVFDARTTKMKLGCALCTLPRDSGILIPHSVRLSDVEDTGRVDLAYSFEGCEQLMWMPEEDRSCRMFNVSNNLRKKLARLPDEESRERGICLPYTNSCEGVNALSMRNSQDGVPYIMGHMDDASYNLHPHIASLCFRSEFLDSVMEAPQGTCVAVGQGTRSKTTASALPRRCGAVFPRNKWVQKDDEYYCVTYSLGNALRFTGQTVAAKRIVEQRHAVSSCKQAAVLARNIGFQVTKTPLSKTSLSHSIRELQKTDGIHLLVLCDNKGSHNHAVAVYQNKIFDANEKRIVALDRRSLHRCVGIGYKCTQIVTCYTITKQCNFV